MLHCPNCDSPIHTDPPRCDVCGYRSDLVQEYFWLYLGGGAVLLLGILFGSLGVFAQGVGPGHWSRSLRGWFPLEPWPESHHWLAFLVVGILMSVSGLGMTRHRPSAWFGLVLLVSYQLVWIVLASFGVVGPGDVAGTAAALGGAALFVLVLLARIGVALRRTPERDAHRMQLRARERQNGSDRGGGKTSHHSGAIVDRPVKPQNDK